MRGLLVSSLAALLAALFSTGINADAGIGITVGAIEVDEQLKPGGRYVLPQVGVINTGDERQEYQLVVSYLDNEGTMRPPTKWLAFEPQRFSLDAGETRAVDVKVTVPAGADPGDYFALIEAQMVNETGQSVQAAVATKLAFTVGDGSWLDGYRREINRWIDDAAPWSYLIPGLLLGTILLRASQRRLRFRLPFELR